MEEEFEEGEKGCLRIYEELGFYSFCKNQSKRKFCLNQDFWRYFLLLWPHFEFSLPS